VGSGVAELGPGVHGALAFGRMQVARCAETDVPADRSHPRAQVFDGGRGGLTVKTAGVAAPIGC
jgi:hypothetical protein